MLSGKNEIQQVVVNFETSVYLMIRDNDNKCLELVALNGHTQKCKELTLKHIELHNTEIIVTWILSENLEHFPQ